MKKEYEIYEDTINRLHERYRELIGCSLYTIKLENAFMKFSLKTTDKVRNAIVKRYIKKYFPTGKEDVSDEISDQLLTEFYKWYLKAMMRILPHQYLDSVDRPFLSDEQKRIIREGRKDNVENKSSYDQEKLIESVNIFLQNHPIEWLEIK